MTSTLLSWYAEHGRELPWRRTRDPYAILVSEVMLQQTQVSRVVPRYDAWLERWPDVHALAAASPADDKRAESHAEGVMQDRVKLFAGDDGLIFARGVQANKVPARFIQAIARHRHWHRELKGQVPA